jgi:hypothetical protein
MLGGGTHVPLPARASRRRRTRQAPLTSRRCRPGPEDPSSPASSASSARPASSGSPASLAGLAAQNCLEAGGVPHVREIVETPCPSRPTRRVCGSGKAVRGGGPGPGRASARPVRPEPGKGGAGSAKMAADPGSRAAAGRPCAAGAAGRTSPARPGRGKFHAPGECLLLPGRPRTVGACTGPGREREPRGAPRTFAAGNCPAPSPPKGGEDQCHPSSISSSRWPASW